MVCALFCSILAGAGLVSCNTYGAYGSAPGTGPGTGPRGTSTAPSTLNYRAFVSNPFNPNATGSFFPGLNIIDATQDLLSFFDVDLSGTTASAGMMVESPTRDRTVMFSPATSTSPNNALGIVNNAQEKGSGSVTLPGPTESMFVWIDNQTLFTAIPTAAVNGQPAGAVLRVDIANQAITATVPVAGAHFVIPSPSGNQILVISDTADSVTVLAPALITTGNPDNALTPVSGTFDRPVWAVFSSDGSTAYVMNCGAQCAGVAASVAVVDMRQSPPTVTSTVPVAAATMGVLANGTLYVAGTPLANAVDCSATLCGVVTVFPSANLAAPPATFAITDGYHDHMVLAQNGQLFIGSRTCTNVTASGSTPGRGCLSVLNTAPGGKVYTSSQNGDVTGIEPISTRTQVYVCEGGALQIYDTSHDIGISGSQLTLQKTQIAITGQAIDVKLADF